MGAAPVPRPPTPRSQAPQTRQSPGRCSGTGMPTAPATRPCGGAVAALEPERVHKPGAGDALSFPGQTHVDAACRHAVQWRACARDVAGARLRCSAAKHGRRGLLWSGSGLVPQRQGGGQRRGGRARHQRRHGRRRARRRAPQPLHNGLCARGGWSGGRVVACRGIELRGTAQTTPANGSAWW